MKMIRETGVFSEKIEIIGTWWLRDEKDLIALVEAGLDPNTVIEREDENLTLLQWALYSYKMDYYKIQVVKVLLEAGADPNLGYENDLTFSKYPLQCSVFGDLTTLLLEYGANPLVEMDIDAYTCDPFFDNGDVYIQAPLIRAFVKALDRAKRAHRLLEEDLAFPPELLEKVLASAQKLGWREIAEKEAFLAEVRREVEREDRDAQGEVVWLGGNKTSTENLFTP